MERTRTLPPLPTGTVTLLFADIEGSTGLLRSLGDRYAGVLSEYHRIVRAALEAYGGLQVDTQGDGLFAVFPRALGALHAAVDTQRALGAGRWPLDAPVRARVGIHTGEPALAEPGYVGIDVHRAARICAAGHGGQILLSQTTRQLVESELPSGITLRDLGDWRLKDLARPERLYQVVGSDLPDGFPPPRSLETASNLPRQLTSFVGRGREIAEMRDQLGRAALLTLTGAGGSGKTRLALEVAAQVLEDYPDGVWWVPLAALTESALVPQSVLTALGVPEQRGVSALQVLLEALRRRRLLLVLDNAEHVLGGCVELVDALLRGCPGIKIMVTSREPLRIDGEHLYPVPPLALPAPGTLAPVDLVARSEAVQLFVERAAAARPSFVLSEQNAAAVLQICRRLDGIPLAVELAAARVRALSVDQIAARLDDQFRLLSDGSRTAPVRQQTLRATMDWSFGLLADAEQRLFRRLGVFAGSFTIEAVERVGAGGIVLPEGVLDLLTRLLEKSMIVADEASGGLRYRLLEPIRRYALARLEETEETADIRLRHRRFYLALAEKGYDGLAGAERTAWRTRLGAEHDDIRAALGWALERGDVEDAALLGAGMARFWTSRGFLDEGWRWLRETRERAGRLSPRARARLLSAIGLLAFEIGEHEEAGVTEEALRLFRGLGDAEGVEVCVRLLGMIELERGRFHRAAPLLEEAARSARARGDGIAEAEALRQRGYLATKQGDYDLAAGLLEQSLDTLRDTGRSRSIGLTLGHLAQTHLYRGQVDRAVKMLGDALDHLAAAEHGTGTAYFLNVLGFARLRQGDLAAAAGAYRRCLQFARQTGYRWAIAESLIGMGALAARRERPVEAVTLLASAAALLRKIDYAIPAAEQAFLTSLLAGLRRRLGPAVYTEASEAGGRMPLGEAAETGLALSDALVSSPPPSAVPSAEARGGKGPVLSRRERQVAVLVAQGRTNREIAGHLGITEKTAGVHVQHILNKLGVNSRAQIAAWAAARGLLGAVSSDDPA